jgi:hypothetical protein
LGACRHYISSSLIPVKMCVSPLARTDQYIWIGNHLNILVLESTGGGKSFVASWLGTAAIRLGYFMRYFRTSRLLHALAHARQDASYSNLLRSMARTDLIILDDWMRDELSPANAQGILEVLDDRYGQAATVIASQMPVTGWFSQIPHPQPELSRCNPGSSDPQSLPDSTNRRVSKKVSSNTVQSEHLMYNNSACSFPSECADYADLVCDFTVLRRIIRLRKKLEIKSTSCVYYSQEVLSLYLVLRIGSIHCYLDISIILSRVQIKTGFMEQ